MENERWLDVGCGTNKICGAIGVDKMKLPGVDIVHDLDIYPWPFEDDSFDHIVCKHSLGHLQNFIRCMEELYRIGRSGAVIEILAPHYASDNFNTDPTHKVAIGVRSLDYFIEGTKLRERYRYSPISFSLRERQISFREAKTDFRKKTKQNLFRMIGFETLVNAFPRLYERFFVYWLPPSEVYFKLVVLKEKSG